MTETIGEQLRKARLQRGLTLEQVSQATHIRVHYLEALENDQRDALPSNVQGRGFLRLYAGHLNLPPGPLLAVWDGIPYNPPDPAEDAVAAPAAPTADSTPPDQIIPGDQQQEPAYLSPPEEMVTPEPVDVETVEKPAGHTPDSSGGSDLIFQEIGRELRQQRETLGLTLAEVERYTRLRSHYIIALEEGRIDELPSPVQGRGMLSNYAAFLNLDEEKVMLRFAEGLQVRRVERIPKQDPQALLTAKKRPARQAPLWRRFLTPDLIFGIGVAAIILFFALWTASRITAQSNAEVVPTPPGISEILLTPILRTTTPDPQETAGASEAMNLTPGPEGEAATDQPTGNSDDDLLSQIPVVQASGTPAVTATLPPMNRDPLQIYIIARQRAWMRVTADGKVKFLGRTVPGNAYAFSGTTRLEMSTGNAAALQVFYNQTDLGILGSNGEVASLVFTADGYATPTAAFTSTPTATSSPTMTPPATATPQATATITPLIP